MQKLIQVDFSAPGDNGKIMVTGTEVPFSMSGDISALQIEDPDFFQRVVDEGFALTGNEEDIPVNWGIVNSWDDAKLKEFTSFMVSKASRENLLEIIDRTFMGNLLKD